MSFQYEKKLIDIHVYVRQVVGMEEICSKGSREKRKIFGREHLNIYI